MDSRCISLHTLTKCSLAAKTLEASTDTQANRASVLQPLVAFKPCRLHSVCLLLYAGAVNKGSEGVSLTVARASGGECCGTAALAHSLQALAKQLKGCLEQRTQLCLQQVSVLMWSPCL